MLQGQEFKGTFEHSIDTKGRLIVPAQFRKNLGEQFVIAKSFADPCLVIYTQESWNSVVADLLSKPMNTAQMRAFKRKIFSSACDCEIDKQGRILIPAELRTFAGIDKDVVSLGVGDRIEVWSEASYNKAEEEFNADPEAFAKMCEEMGITL